MREKTLFFITASFPYGHGETFVESEIPYLADYFDKIIIISNAVEFNVVRPVPQNTEIICFPYLPTKIEKLLSLKYLTAKALREELQTVKNGYQIPVTQSIIAAALGSLYKGEQLCKFIIKLIKNKKLLQNDVHVYSYWTNDMATGIALLKQKLKGNIKVYARAHGWDVYHERSEINYLPFRNLIFSNLDKVYFISNQGLHYTIKKMGKAYTSFEVLKLGTKNNGRLNPYHKTNQFHVVSCSSVNKVKRLDLIVKALSLIPEEYNIKWSHIGEGPLITEIKDLTESLLSAKKNIRFNLLGQLKNPKLMEFYETASIDLFLNVSSSEGIPVSIMEAMSKAIPALATQVGGTDELVNEQNGFVISAEITAQELANKITTIIHLNEEQSKVKKLEAYNTWNLNYNAGINYNKFIRAISNM